MKYSMLLSTGEMEDEISEEVELMVFGSYVDGIILLYSRVNDRIMNFLREENFPFVMVGKPYDHISEITHVDNDNFRAGEEITVDLIRNGHQKIALDRKSTRLNSS